MSQGKTQPKLRGGGSGTALAIRVVPRSSRNEVAEVMDGGLVKIRITAAPVDGKGNACLIDFLAEFFSVPKKNIEIVTGESSREKLVSILGISADAAQALINVAIAKRKT